MHRLAGLTLLALVPAFVHAECRYTAERNFDVPASGVRTLAFELGSNDLVVEGAPGQTTIEVRGRACSSDAAWLDELTVEQHRDGDRVTIKPHAGHDIHFGYAYVDLRVRVPANLAVVAKGDSGDVEARNIGSLEFDTSSGDLVADHVAGKLGAEVSSGDIRATDIGDVDIRRTSSGDISLRDVHGPASIARSGSGDLHLDRVASVSIGQVGSGDVRVSDASSDVSIESIGSGDITVTDVGGDFRVGSRGSGDVSHRNVRGKVSVPHDDDDDDND
ncbi:MAG: DUF4097 family beta strand repeat-containing protein [Rhodanobacteraceae bacterium]